MIKCITLTQPWATLVAIGAKRIETRSWSTSYRGPLAIHAAKGLGPVGGRQGLRDLCVSEFFYPALYVHIDRTEDLPLGAIVAVCRLVDCVPTEWVAMPPPAAPRIARDQNVWELTDQERAFGDYSAGRFAWLLADIQALPEPIPCKGALGLWEPDANILEAINQQV